MSSPEILDFAKLLAAVPGDKPTGSDLRADTSPLADYYAIRDARKLASATERRIDKGEETVEPPDWRPILDRATAVLATKSKDLEINAYLIEALVRLKHFPGLRDGFRLAKELVERYWEDLYPVAQEGDTPDSRFSHILYLNGIEAPGTLMVPIRRIPLTEETSQGTFNLTHYQLAQNLLQISDPKLRQKRIDDGAVTLETLQKAVTETPAKFYNELVANLNEAAEEFRLFCDALKTKSGYDPPAMDLRQVLETYLDAVKDLARDKLDKAAASSAAGSPGSPEGGSAGAAAQIAAHGVNASVIKDRNDAFERLRKIADYFREQEPQSIIPYALEQVAIWGRMSLPELLSELIPEESARKNFFKQVGIKPPEPKK
jgi:type VI secretion system protein ImpA